jgi:hypothetical protein
MLQYRRVRKTAGKAMENQELAKKSAKDDLFSRLISAYTPSGGSTLWFPFRQIIQARAWRGHPTPDFTALRNQLVSLSETIPRVVLEILIMVTESLFRPLRRFEIEVEKVLPEFVGWGFENEEPESVLSFKIGELCRQKNSSLVELGNWLPEVFR